MNQLLTWLGQPLVVFLLSLSPLVALILGLINDFPSGINCFLCSILDLFLIIWPSTPDSLKIGFLLSAIASTYPGLGWGIVWDVFQSAFTVLSLISAVKVYKLLPFKLS